MRVELDNGMKVGVADDNPAGQRGRRKHHTALALAICGRCTVSDECLAHALSHKEEYGIWAGTTPEDRQALRRLLRRRRTAS